MSSVITVKQARKRLGKRYAVLSDEQIEQLISLLGNVAKLSVAAYGSKSL